MSRTALGGVVEAYPDKLGFEQLIGRSIDLYFEAGTTTSCSTQDSNLLLPSTSAVARTGLTEHLLHCWSVVNTEGAQLAHYSLTAAAITVRRSSASKTRLWHQSRMLKSMKEYRVLLRLHLSIHN